MTLPAFIPPMLAKLSEPFSSEEHLFELKWDGMRTLVFVEDSVPRAVNRNRNDVTDRYPELQAAGQLADGTVIDGEVTVMRDGMPYFNGLLRREQVKNPHRIAVLAAELPATYIAFDLLYRDGESVMDQPLEARRSALRDMVSALEDPRLVYSDGIVGDGEGYFAQAVAADIEGVVAKKLGSRYLPGQRTDLWRKFKKSVQIYCVIIGYVAEADEIRSLVVATEDDGVLRSVGRVGSGLDAGTKERLARLLPPLARNDPVVATPHEAVWTEPEVFCVVKYLERTPSGELRAPVFVQLVD